jgi:hypothetical protein
MAAMFYDLKNKQINFSSSSRSFRSESIETRKKEKKSSRNAREFAILFVEFARILDNSKIGGKCYPRGLQFEWKCYPAG